MTARGTTNTNVRGNTEDRLRRRRWLVETYRADVDLHIVDGWRLAAPVGALPLGKRETGLEVLKVCRCYRCGELLTEDTVSPDRIKPGIDGGTYRRDNIRPACARCQSVTGNLLKQARSKKK